MHTENMSQQNNWDKLRSKVEGFRPDEYSPADWKEMETLLDSAAPIRPKRGVLWALKLRSWRGWAVPFVAVLATAAFYMVQNARLDEHAPAVPAGNARSMPTEPVQPTAGPLRPTSPGTATSPENGTATAENAAVPPGASNPAQAGIDRENALGQPMAGQRPSGRTSAKEKGIDRGTGAVPSIAGSAEGANTAAPSVTEPGPTALTTGPVASIEEILMAETAARQGDMAAVPTPGLPVLAVPVSVPAHQAPPLATMPIRRVLGKKTARFGVVLGVNNSVTDYQDFTRSHYPFVGLFAARRLSGRWEAQLEGHLKTVDKYDLSQSFTEYEVQRNKTLSATTRTVFYHRYDALEFPMVFKYTLSNRLGLIGGVRPSFIAGNRRNHSFVFFREKDNSGLPFRGFWNFDMGLVAGMEYYVSPRCLLDLRWNQGLRDLTPDNLYQSDAIHLNSDLQFSVRYLLF
jgi:hypothetical protein